MAEHRYWAVREVLGGCPVGKVAVRYGTSRQSWHVWRRWFEWEGLAGLADRSRRPAASPTRLAAQVEAAICDMRRQYPRSGARWTTFELSRDGGLPPSRATVHRFLPVTGWSWCRSGSMPACTGGGSGEAPMQLWQPDLVGGGGVSRRPGMQAADRDRRPLGFAGIATVVAIPSPAGGLRGVHRGDAPLWGAARGSHGQRHPVHRPVASRSAGRGALRTHLPGGQDPVTLHEDQVVDHHGEDGALPQDH